MVFRNALANELNAILSLYQSAIGDPFCSWNEFYPGMEEIEADFRAGCLYVLAGENAIFGALSVVPENEMDEFACWRIPRQAREIARVAVSKDCRGRGLARHMVNCIAHKLRAGDCRAIHLAVAKQNLPAQRAYARAGFEAVGDARMYGSSYFLMEKEL